MSKERVLFGVIIVSAFFSLVVTTSAQVPMPTGIECVPAPGMPCPGARAGTSRASSNANLALKRQLAGSIAEAFVQFLFSSKDSNAEAQKQQMMAELARRQAEAARQHNPEEALRLQAVCERLSATLKLNGLPERTTGRSSSMSVGQAKRWWKSS